MSQVRRSDGPPLELAALLTRLRLLRIARGLSIDEMSTRAGFKSKWVVQNLETRGRGLDYRVLVAYCDVFDIDVSRMIDSRPIELCDSATQV